jgi:hypothetical protein
MDAFPRLAALLVAVLALPAQAILTRADRNDEEYRELATRYAAAVTVGSPAVPGALIAPRWVLTSAAVAEGLRGRTAPGAGGVILEIFLHPEWKPGGEADIALVFLRAPVEGIEPVPVYRQADEAGQAARVVGRGATGRIGSPARGPGGAWRAAINTVDRVTPRTLGLRLKGPEDASDLQGALAADDLGTPAFLEAGGRILVGGIASRTDDADRDGIAGGIGDWEIYTRVSAFADWIDDTMSKAAVAEAAREVVKPAPGRRP